MDNKLDNKYLWQKLGEHAGHDIVIARYGSAEDPEDICLECEDCGCVILDAELYTVAARDDL